MVAPQVLTQLAPIVASTLEREEVALRRMETWLLADPARVRALLRITVALAQSYNVLPDTLRAWAKAYRKSTHERWRK